MYVWNTAIVSVISTSFLPEISRLILSQPYRDGDLEAGIVIHELSHGLSTRLTGGPMNSGCLGWGESGGMGEGWGDFIASTVRAHKKYQDIPMGAWASNQDGGIRNYPYSTVNVLPILHPPHSTNTPFPELHHQPIDVQNPGQARLLGCSCYRRSLGRNSVGSRAQDDQETRLFRGSFPPTA